MPKLTLEKLEKRRANWRAYAARSKDKIRDIRKRYIKANPEKIKRWKANSYQRHKDSIRSQHADYYRKNKKAMNAASRKYVEAHREKISKYQSEYGERNKRKLREQNDLWRKKNKHLVRAARSRRRARLKNAKVDSGKTIAVWEKSWKSHELVRCYHCNKMVSPKKCHSDHVIPLSKGGAHSITNLCISCDPCNRKKAAKSIDRWNTSLEQPLLCL